MPNPTTTPKTVAITFDPATKAISCPNRIELDDGDAVEWKLEGAATFYLQFVEISPARGGRPGKWPFRGGDEALFRADAKPATGSNVQSPAPATWATTVSNPGQKPRVLKYTIVVSDGTGVYTLDPNVVIDPM